MLNVLIVYAVEPERVHLNMPHCTFQYCCTGIGKVPAAIAVEKAIMAYHPDVVINIGTAGTVNYEVGSIHLCSKFIDRDMEKLAAFGIPCEEDFSDEVVSSGFFKNWTFDSVCNTGDSFLTSSDGTGDVFDMESFAVARVCRTHQIPFVGVKCVTDVIGQNSVKHWEDKLAEAQALLQAFGDNNHLTVPTQFVSREVGQLIQRLDLMPHPEGGWYKEVYRSSMKLSKLGLSGVFSGDRNALTSIYYLLTHGQCSAYHRIQSPEVWYFHKGFPLLIHVISSDGLYSVVELSDKEEGVLQYAVPENSWFAAEIKSHYGFSLVSCAVAPGFDFEDFELASYTTICEQYPIIKNQLKPELFEK